MAISKLDQTLHPYPPVKRNATGNKLGLLRLVVFCVAAFAVGIVGGNAAKGATTRIKDIVDVEGVRDNMLVGYGLVVGLNGTGDSLSNSPFTEQSLQGMLDRLGVNVRGSNLNTNNVAAVIVTATLPPFSTQGSRIDVTISALGDAQSLLGGQLLVTPLMGADGEIYAVAQGAVSTSGFNAGGNAQTVTKGVPTGGRIANGAIIEREVSFDLAEMRTIRLALRNPDFTTARRIAKTVNRYLRDPIAHVNDPGTVTLTLPANGDLDPVDVITDIEQLTIEPDQVARVVIDEASGIIVMGDNVRISTVAIAQGNLTIRITEMPQVSQPGAFSETGETAIVDRTTIDIDEDSDNKLAVMPSGVTLHQLVQSLNALGVGPRDMIAILQSIKAAGALQAEIELI